MQLIRYITAFLLVAALFLSGCKASPPAVTPKAQGALKTQVVYLQRIMLPPGSTLTVTFEDVSRMDAPADIIARETLEITTGPPYAVDLLYDPAGLEDRARYAVRARIENNGRLLFISTTHIDPFASPEPVEILVEPVAN